MHFKTLSNLNKEKVSNWYMVMNKTCYSYLSIKITHMRIDLVDSGERIFPIKNNKKIDESYLMVDE